MPVKMDLGKESVYKSMSTWEMQSLEMSIFCEGHAGMADLEISSLKMKSKSPFWIGPSQSL